MRHNIRAKLGIIKVKNMEVGQLFKLECQCLWVLSGRYKASKQLVYTYSLFQHCSCFNNLFMSKDLIWPIKEETYVFIP